MRSKDGLLSIWAETSWGFSRGDTRIISAKSSSGASAGLFTPKVEKRVRDSKHKNHQKETEGLLHSENIRAVKLTDSFCLPRSLFDNTGFVEGVFKRPRTKAEVSAISERAHFFLGPLHWSSELRSRRDRLQGAGHNYKPEV